MDVKRGKFITFEGVDGSGKSTQIRLVSDWLETAGIDVLLTREPGGTRIGEKIRELLLDTDHTEMTAMTEMLLYAAARAQIVAQVIEPALAAGKWVICDRWVDSSIAYQGGARGLGDAVRFVNTCAAGELFSPDATVLLDIDPQEALLRDIACGKRQDRIESLGIAYQAKVRAAYLEIAASDPGRVSVVSAMGAPAAVFARVCAILSARQWGVVS